MFKDRQNSAQGLVELALSLPLLLILVLGALDFGRAFYLKVILENSAREGAYFMVYESADGKVNNFALAKAAVQIEGQNSGLAIPTGDIEIFCKQGNVVNNTCPNGSIVVVRATHQMDLVVLAFFTGPIDLTGEARMLIP